MSTLDVKTLQSPTNFDLTLDAQGSGQDIIFKSNGSTVASLTDAGLLTATTFAGSGASLTALNGTQVTSGTVPAARMPAGSVIQVVSSYTSSEVASTSASYADTGLSCAITPSATSSKILVLAHQSFGKTAFNTQVDANLLKDSSTVVNQWLNDDVRTGDATALACPPAALVYLDSPSTTSATTYKTQFRNAAATGQVLANTNNGASKIVLMEIAG